MQPFTEKDVKQAIFSIDRNRSPGPDGCGSGFYKDGLAYCGPNITKVVLEFLHNGKLLR